MRRAFLLHTVSAVFAMTMMAGQAPAAQIAQISYSVTGGTFNRSGGIAITGGTLVYTPPGGSVSTPAYNVYGGVLQLSLTGTQFSVLSSFFSVSFAGNLSDFVRANFTTAGDFTVLALRTQSTGNPFGASGYPVPLPLIRAHLDLFDLEAGVSFGTVTGSTLVGGSFDHRFTIGSEVRTLVPEPGTATLLGLGLLGLGLVATSRGATSRALRRRRG